MNQSNTNTEKIRSILAAMERSIDVARRKRLHESGESPDAVSHEDIDRTESSTNQPAESSSESRESDTASDRIYGPITNGSGSSASEQESNPQRADDHDDTPSRLKAKPKRPSDFFKSSAEAQWQSRAG